VTRLAPIRPTPLFLNPQPKPGEDQMSKTTTKPATRKKPTRGELAKIRETTDSKAAKVAAMNSAERKRLTALYNSEMDKRTLTTEAAESDLLSVIMAVVIELAHKYYPNCQHASVTIDAEPRDKKWPVKYASIPVIVPEKKNES
jgi:hypothetical protein